MSELEEVLTNLMRRVPGATLAAVGGMDGLLVEQVPAEHDELPEVVAELTMVVSVARRALGEILDGGSLERLSLKANRISVGIWVVSEDFYCLVAGDLPIDMAAVGPAADEALGRIRESLT